MQQQEVTLRIKAAAASRVDSFKIIVAMLESSVDLAIKKTALI
jgi:hypothetical protein